MITITHEVVMPTFYGFLRANEARFGLKLGARSLGDPVIEYQSSDARPGFKVVGEKFGTNIYVYVAVPLKETPSWLQDLINAYEGVLSDWDTTEGLGGITVHSVYKSSDEEAAE